MSIKETAANAVERYMEAFRQGDIAAAAAFYADSYAVWTDKGPELIIQSAIPQRIAGLRDSALQDGTALTVLQADTTQLGRNISAVSCLLEWKSSGGLRLQEVTYLLSYDETWRIGAVLPGRLLGGEALA
jgi:hypothetical protein